MKRILMLAALAAALAGISEIACADGFIVLRPPQPHLTPIPLAVKYHHVDVKIEDQIAVTSIDQVFFNPNAMQLEGTYLFPLPEGAAVSGMSMWINGQETQGELLPRDQAVKIYTDIVRKLKDPAVLEYMGSRLFRMRIFPIEPHSEKRIKIEYAEKLELESGLVTYRYPLSTEKFSSQPLKDLFVNVQLNSQVPIKTLFSPRPMRWRSPEKAIQRPGSAMKQET
ncbi:MAG: VIT domain-containing protein [Planctomycetota bacterium]